MPIRKSSPKKDILQDLKITRSNFENSAAWFKKEVENLGTNDTRRAILKLQSRATKYPVMGRMYLFAYDPKWKDALPVYDRFPLIFPFAKAEGGFLGINLHFIPVPLRVRVINELSQFANNSSMSATTRIVAQWNIIKALSQSKGLGLENCVKHYLTNHIRSAIIEIPPTSWHLTATLQLERLVYKA